MEKITLSSKLEVSKLVHGHWRLVEWQLSSQKLNLLVNQVIDLGITTFDHADIYGNYECEEEFGHALQIQDGLRQRLQLVTKCGIKIISDKFPSREIGHYDYSRNHIISSVENSLKHFHTDYIDLLLLHRPSPFFNPEEVADAFSELSKSGKVLHFGVSNFSAEQYEMLNTFTEAPLATNQVELSPYCLDHFQNGNIEYFLQHKIHPMAWSPLAGGEIMNPTTEKGVRVLSCLTNVANEMDIGIDQLIYAWLFNHPAGIIPVLGSGRIERIKNAVDALEIRIDIENWLKIYVAALGETLP